MNNSRSGKKGFTLVELCIVIALISIALLLMTSFMTVFQTRTAMNQTRHDFLDEVSLVRDEMKKWIDANDAGSVVLEVASSDSEDDKIIYRSGDVYAISRYVSFSDGVIVFSNEASESKSLELKTIKVITLEAYDPEQLHDPEDDTKLLPTPSNTGKLLRCTLTGYDVYGKPYTQNLIFALDTNTATFQNADSGLES